ncbi:MAG: hypothetical protein ACK4HR_00515 [Hyphomonas sp.]|jgi:hypothetical protein
MTVFWFRQALLFLASAAVCCLAGGAALAGTEPAGEVAEAPPGILGIDLPLRAGERLAPTADGACSVVVFAPHEERYERLAGYWSQARWIGDCRFGLAHGDGLIVGAGGHVSLPATMLYGVEVTAPELARSGILQAGEVSWDGSLPVLSFHSGPAFSDLSASRYVVRYGNAPDGQAETEGDVSYWYGSTYVEKHTFDADGREWVMSLSIWNVDTYCGLGIPPEFKPHEREVRKACKKNTPDKLVLFRREGHLAEPWASRPITWLKSCAVNRSTRTNECGKLVREALGKEAAEFETLLTRGDAAARSAAEQEIIDRFAPLERAVEGLVLAAEELHE